MTFRAKEMVSLDGGFPDGRLRVNCGSCISSEIGEYYSWLDVAAISYLALKAVVSTEAGFLAEFFEEGATSEASNPNLATLELLSTSVEEIVLRQLRHHTSSSSALDSFLNTVSDIQLDAFGDSVYNKVTPFWAIIRGIDQAYGDYDGFASTIRRGPLNTVKKGSIGVYLSAPPSVMSTALHQSGLKRIPEFSFNNQLWYIHFYVREKDRCLPKIRLVKSENERNEPLFDLPDSYEGIARPKGDWSIVKSRAAGLSLRGLPHEVGVWPEHVRIGMAQFSPVVITGVANGLTGGEIPPETEAWPITFSAPRGRNLTAEYVDGYRSTYEATVIGALDTCLRHSCQVVVFPEIVISPGLREVICSYLENPKLRKRPLLVVAGSSWEQGEAFGNNVSYLYDGYGHEVGQYYKHSNYGRYEDAEHVEYVEGLDDPGKECTILDVEGIGRVLPSICKDLASEKRFTLDLATSFCPNIVCVPALSPSMDTAFSGPVTELSERSLSVSVVCNQCGRMAGREGGVATVGMVGAPLLNTGSGTRTQCLTLPITRNEKCHGHCLAQLDANGKSSCVHIIDINL